MLVSGETGEHAQPTAKQVYDRLASEYEMTGVSYSTVRNYIADRGLIPQTLTRHSGGSAHEVQRAVMRLRELFEAMQPGAAVRAQPHLDALDLVVKQALGATGADSHGSSGPGGQSSPENRSHAACLDTPRACPMRVQLMPRARRTPTWSWTAASAWATTAWVRARLASS